MNKKDIPGEYSIQHSANGTDFSTIEQVQQSQWSYTHQNATGDLHYYRIGFRPYGGALQYSAVVKINTKGKPALMLAVNPNPVEGGLLPLYLSNFKKGNYNLMLTDQKGSLVYQSVLPVQQGNSMQIVTVSNNIPSGIYTIMITGLNGAAIQKQVLFR
jgi:hypothetical protein